MVKVTELGYLGISVSDADAWKSYVSEVIGLEIFDKGEKDRFYLRADDWHHRFIVHSGSDDDYAYSGWRVPGRPELEEMARNFDGLGIPYRFGTPEEAKERHVLGLIKLNDPSGNALEIFYGPEISAKKPFHPSRPLFGKFLTGDAGLGHCILRADDMGAALEFYRHLGFVGDIEYKMNVGGMLVEAAFMCVNARQHAIAFGGGDTGKRINHFMLEYTDIRDLGISYDIAQQLQLPIPMNLGMHANDKMLSFYVGNPSAWTFELGWAGCAPPSQQVYYTSDIFGHASTASGFGLDIDVSDV